MDEKCPENSRTERFDELCEKVRKGIDGLYAAGPALLEILMDRLHEGDYQSARDWWEETVGGATLGPRARERYRKPGSRRPLRDLKIGDLSELFFDSLDDPESLRELLKELFHRKSHGAKNLRALVVIRLEQLEYGDQDDTDW